MKSRNMSKMRSTVGISWEDPVSIKPGTSRDEADIVEEYTDMKVSDLGFRVVRDDAHVPMTGTTHKDEKDTARTSRFYERRKDSPRQITGFRLAADII